MLQSRKLKAGIGFVLILMGYGIIAINFFGFPYLLEGIVAVEGDNPPFPVSQIPIVMLLIMFVTGLLVAFLGGRMMYSGLSRRPSENTKSEQSMRKG